MKKVSVDIYSPMSEAVKDQVLTDADVDSNAATVIRDSNGKVIKVIVNLPDSAADIAAEKIGITT